MSFLVTVQDDNGSSFSVELHTVYAVVELVRATTATSPIITVERVAA